MPSWVNSTPSSLNNSNFLCWLIPLGRIFHLPFIPAYVSVAADYAVAGDFGREEGYVDMRRLWREGRSLGRGPGKRRLLGGREGFGRGACRRGVGRGLVVLLLRVRLI